MSAGMWHVIFSAVPPIIRGMILVRVANSRWTPLCIVMLVPRKASGVLDTFEKERKHARAQLEL